MSQLIVEVVTIDAVNPHTNADKLECAIIKGFQVVAGKGNHKPGDVVVFIPYNSVVPQELSDKYAFTQYLSKGRVKVAKLRGEPSYGVIIPNECNWAVGEDVTERLGIKKWTPEVRNSTSIGGAARADEECQHLLFPKYTEIENLRHYNTVIQEGEEVVVSEKIHGSNARIGMVEGEQMAGSRNRRLRLPTVPVPCGWLKRLYCRVFKRPLPSKVNVEAMKNNWWWMPWTLPEVAALLTSLGKEHKQVVLYGEIYGANVQKGVRYGSADKVSFRAFDLLVDGKYLDYDFFLFQCKTHNVETAPVLYRGPYSLDKIKELSKGKTTIGEGETHIREGVVVKPSVDRRDHKVGRVVLKYVSEDYLAAKDIGDFEDE